MQKEKIVLINDLSPGDVLIMTVALRSLHKAYPEQYITDVRSPCQEIFENSPYVTPLAAKDKNKEHLAIETLKKNENHPAIVIQDINGDDMKYIISHYPEIHRSKMTGLPFVDGHRMFLEKQLNISIPRSGMKPDIFLSEKEKDTFPDFILNIYNEPYWIINAGIKNDYTLKYYSHYQEVVDLLKDEIQFVQVGHASHNHPPLKGVVDWRGKTTLRELFVLSYHAEGALCCVTMQMVIMAAFGKPCVVVAGAREGVRWQLNPDHQFLYRNGAMKCAPYDGCWKSKLEQCDFKSDSGQPMCLELIKPEEIARAIQLYYLGGRLTPNHLTTSERWYEKKDKDVEVAKAIDINYADKKEEMKKIMNEQANDDLHKMPTEISLKPADFFGNPEMQKYATAAIMNTLRILKKNNPDDTYLEAYYWHYEKQGDKFTDLYHFLWWLGANVNPKRILEIGCRTGVSICQLLSACMYYDKIERIILCDNFSEIGNQGVVLDNIQYLNIPINKIEFLIGDSLELIPKINEDFDFILVDAGHDKAYATADLTNAADLIALNGYIAFDDLTPDGCSLQDVWDSFKAIYKDIFSFSETQNGKGLGIARRI